MALTPATLAFDIIRRAGDRVQKCKYEPREQEANAIGLFMGRKPGHETFITEPQAALFAKLLGGVGRLITTGFDDNKFGAYIKTVYSKTHGKDYYILVFGGYVPPAGPEAPVVAPAVKAAPPAPKTLPGGVIPLDIDVPF